MGKETGITWTDHTFNPWWGCIKVSAGCEHCYAEVLSDQRGYSQMKLPIWGPAKTTPRRTWAHDSKHWQEPLTWQRHAEADRRRHRVFCASMADVFEDHPQLPPERTKLWELIEQTPLLDWQLLTKRPENVLHMVPEDWRSELPPNVWLGTSVEDERVVDRIGELLKVNAWISWLSVEPMIGPIDLEPWLPFIDWIVVGGESGPGHRPFDLQWARHVRDQCRFLETAFFFKQVGGATPKSGGDLLDGAEHKEFPRDRSWKLPEVARV